MITTNLANSILSNLISTAGYLGLSTSAPSNDGSGASEPSGNGYTRVNYRSAMGTPRGGSVTNVKEIHFNMATGSWGTCTHYVLFSSESSNVVLAYGALDNAISPGNETIPIVPVGAITMSIS